MLVLPIGDTFLYVEPLYIQASEARMPQLKKVTLAIGNRLIYTDTYDQALAQLTSGVQTGTAPAIGRRYRRPRRRPEPRRSRRQPDQPLPGSNPSETTCGVTATSQPRAAGPKRAKRPRRSRRRQARNSSGRDPRTAWISEASAGIVHVQ